MWRKEAKYLYLILWFIFQISIYPQWHIYVVDTPSSSVCGTSLTLINGKPAIGYIGYTDGDLKYIRALDSYGNDWGTSLTIDDTAYDSLCGTARATLLEVNGNPAIAYSVSQTNARYIKYVRAVDQNGECWNTPITINDQGAWAFPCMIVVDGKPGHYIFNIW